MRASPGWHAGAHRWPGVLWPMPADGTAEASGARGMRRNVLRVLPVAAVLGAVLLAIGLLLPVPSVYLVDGYILAVGALLLLALARATGRADARAESVYESALRRPVRGPRRPDALERLEREIVLGMASTFDLHARVRPVLRDIAAHRLATRHGLDLDHGDPATRGLLGDELWELVRPDRPLPEQRFERGITLERLRAHIDRIERI